MYSLELASAAYNEGGLADAVDAYADEDDGADEGEKSKVKERGGGEDEMEVDEDDVSVGQAEEQGAEREACTPDASVGGVGRGKDPPAGGGGRGRNDAEKKTAAAQAELGLLDNVRAVSHRSLEQNLIGKAEAAAAAAEEAEKEAAQAIKVGGCLCLALCRTSPLEIRKLPGNNTATHETSLSLSLSLSGLTVAHA